VLYPRTDRQKRFVQIARNLAPIFQARAAQHDREGTFPHENFADIRAAGLPALIIPEEFGGWGADLLESVLAMEALGAGDGSTALSFVMHVQVLGAVAESRSWPEALFAQVCRDAVERGALINAVATEPRLGSPSRGGLPDTTAAPFYAIGSQDASGEPDAWIVNGRKSFASLSPELDYFVVPAALQDGSGHVARFVIPAGEHVRIIETWDSLGMRSTGSHDIEFINARVDASQMLGRGGPEVGDPARATHNAWFALTVSAVYLGVAQAALEYAAQFAQERTPTALGKPIASLEAIQRRLGQADLLITQARALIYGVAREWSEQPESRAALSPFVVAAKVTATNNAIEAVDHCLRVVGGSSMNRSLPLERYFRDVRPGIFHPLNDDQALTMFGRIALQRVADGQTTPESTNSNPVTA
jgi:alkylation response protein AidB-like acyl-CoA dehydrogenase